jgi:hypothetical protein
LSASEVSIEMHGLRSSGALLLLVVVGTGLHGQNPAPSRGPNADRRGADLVSRLLRYQQTPGFRTRARLTVTSTGLGSATMAQVRILGSHDARTTRLLYQVIWPRPVRGYALYVERKSDPAVESSGFLFEPPDRVTPLTREVRTHAFLASDLLIEDLIEDFWRWPSQRVAGEASVEGQACTILESRPPAETGSVYSLVRTWIAQARPVPMRIDKLDRNGQPAGRMTLSGPSRRGAEGPTPARLVVEVPGSAHTTSVEYFGGERDIVVPAEEFSLERLKRAAAGK